MRTLTGLIAAAAIVSGAASAAAAVDRNVPPDEDRFVNAPLPNIAITTAAGVRTDVMSVAAGRPLLLALVFTRCAGVCSPFLSSWRAADAWLLQRPPVARLVLSFDARDTAEDMAAFAHHVAADADRDWTFAVAAPNDVRRLADAVGFWYDWDESRQQFDHPAMLAAARGGRVIRLLVGATVPSARLDELTREASGEFVASYPLPGGPTFRCVQYDPRTGRVSLDWGSTLLLVPLVTIGLTTMVMFVRGAAARRRA